MDKATEYHELIGQPCGDIAEESQHISGAVKRMSHEAARNCRTYRMNPIFEGRSHAKIATPAAHRPEQVIVFVGARLHDLALRGNDVHRKEVVERETILAHQPAQSSAEGKPRNASGGYDAAGGGQAVDLRLTVILGPCNATLRPGGAEFWIDVNAFHGSQVDHEPA